jgi:hypothetical protein
MASRTPPQYGVTFSLVVAALVAIAVAGSVWGKSSGPSRAAETTGIDVHALTSRADTANLPVLIVDEPF